MNSLFAYVLGLALCSGCASNVEVTRTVSPAEASRARGFSPVSLVRGDEKIPLPAGARIEAGRVVLPMEKGVRVHKLGPNDVIEEDAEGRIVAVKRGGEILARFRPGTAVSPENSDEVRGEAPDAVADTLPLGPKDQIEMRGSFGPDEPIPGGGRVESNRSTGLLLAGITVFALGYLPAAYVGVASSRAPDRTLLVPAAGPWINLAGRGACQPPPGSELLPVDPCVEETASRVALVVSGGVQGIGAVLTAFGLSSRSEVVYDRRSGGKDSQARVARRSHTLVPVFMGSGAHLFGQF